MSRLLDGKTVIVTGAGGGIGHEACRVLAKAGARLVITDISVDSGRATLQAVKDEGGDAIFHAADLSSEQEISALVDATLKQYGRLDGAFNNAGVEQKNKPLDELTIEEWDRAIRVDLTAVFLCIKYQVKAMLKSGSGAIVNTASSLGQVAIPGASEYVAAKHGVVGLTRAAGADYGRRGIRVNAVLPGVIRTPMIARLSNEPAFAPVLNRVKERHSMGRFGEPKEVGEAVAWLLSDSASFMNGAAVAVDGGYLSI